ncbi:hypothetical protein RM553_04785 [Zunongwangia sp. F363]|uniref:Lipoprotein n=1 Tax=Autumnicola tepida TaxID=3075595 RepID=A0ABU3C722_9FLAO|nr:hypothetical protein [Zunongwangia sp. F363]MDT0642142.1 hypothetical protein [Zunongwangia sp. F363]
MKHAYLLLSSIFVFSLFASCGSNKELQEAPPAQFRQAYTTSEDAALLLHIPVVAIQENRVSLESVYFRGMKSPLKQNEEIPGEYVARFNTKDPSMIMSSDPKEEYGNKPPQKPQKSPVELKSDEALLVFAKNAATKFYKLEGIVEKD